MLAGTFDSTALFGGEALGDILQVVRVQLKKSKVIVLTDGCMGLEGE